MTTPRVRRAALAFILVTVTSACVGTSALRADQLTITAPAELATVQLPVTVEWRAAHLPASVTQFAVFVDRGPMGTGDDVRSLVDDQCRHRRGCPDAAYLRTLGIYLTQNRQLALPTLQTLGGLSAATAQPVHRVTVVALDGDGRRVGEYSAIARFRFER